MAVKKDYQKDTSKSDFSENEKNELELKNSKTSPVVGETKKMKYPVEAKEDIFCDKDKITNIPVDKPEHVVESVFIISANPMLESVGIDHKEIIDFDNSNIVKLRMTSASASLSYKIPKGSKLFDLVPIA